MTEIHDIIESDDKPDIDFELQGILNRYASGDPVCEIASGIPGGRSMTYVYKRLNELPEKYEHAKERRETVRGIKLRRNEALSDNIVRIKLESITEEEAAKLPICELKRIAEIGRIYGEKANLAEGKATSIVSERVEPTAAEWEEFWEKKQMAGDGIDKESVAT